MQPCKDGEGRDTGGIRTFHAPVKGRWRRVCRQRRGQPRRACPCSEEAASCGELDRPLVCDGLLPAGGVPRGVDLGGGARRPASQAGAPGLAPPRLLRRASHVRLLP